MDMQVGRVEALEDEYYLVEAESGEEALNIIKAQRPHLIVLDLMLPGIDGLTVCNRLKKSSKTAQIPIIMLTAKGEESDIIKGLELGADDYVTKPFSPKVLLARVCSSYAEVFRKKQTVIRSKSTTW